jgi:DNA-binding NtrC family response regulator
MKWIKTLELKGNYRDLQNIIRYYCIFDKFDTHSRQEICSEMKIPVSAFEYAKKCYEMYHSNPPSMDKIEVKIDDNNAQNIEKEFHRQLTNWAIKKFGSRKEAAIQLNVSEKTLNNWSREV